MSHQNETSYMKASEVAQLLNITTRTLTNWRRQKKGPKCALWNGKQIRYPRNRVLDWIAKSSCDES